MKHPFSNYNPPYLYLLTLSTFLPMEKLYSIKLISILFDFIAAILGYLVVRMKYRRGFVPLLSFAMILFAPTVVFNGSLWAQCDVIYTTGLLASLYCLLKKKHALALFFFSIALSFKMQALFFFPLLFTLWLREKIPIHAFLLIPGVFLLSIFPCLILGRPFLSLISIFYNQASTFQALTMNAPNLYQWLPNEHYLLLSKAGFVYAMMVGVLYSLSVYKSRVEIDEEVILKLSFLSVLLIPFFLPKMHERFFFPADVFSILYAFYFPKYFYMPILVGGASFFSYYPFLFGKTVFSSMHLPLLLLLVIVIAGVDLIRHLYPSWRGSEKTAEGVARVETSCCASADARENPQAPNDRHAGKG